MIALSVETTLATWGEMTPGGFASGRVGETELLVITGTNCGTDTGRINVSVTGSSFISVSAIAEPSEAPIAKAFCLKDSLGFTVAEGGASVSSAIGETFGGGSCDSAAGGVDSSA